MEHITDSSANMHIISSGPCLPVVPASRPKGHRRPHPLPLLQRVDGQELCGRRPDGQVQPCIGQVQVPGTGTGTGTGTALYRPSWSSEDVSGTSSEAGTTGCRPMPRSGSSVDSPDSPPLGGRATFNMLISSIVIARSTPREVRRDTWKKLKGVYRQV